MRPEIRSVLERRSVADKIAIAIDCDLCPVDDLPAVAELVRDGILVWIDRACLMHIGVKRPDGSMLRGLNADVYRLTAKGIALCEANGIPQQ